MYKVFYLSVINTSCVSKIYFPDSVMLLQSPRWSELMKLLNFCSWPLTTSYKPARSGWLRFLEEKRRHYAHIRWLQRSLSDLLCRYYIYYSFSVTKFWGCGLVTFNFRATNEGNISQHVLVVSFPAPTSFSHQRFLVLWWQYSPNLAVLRYRHICFGDNDVCSVDLKNIVYYLGLSPQCFIISTMPIWGRLQR